MKPTVKIGSLLLAVVMALSAVLATGCSMGKEWSYKTRDKELAIGVYIYCLDLAYQQAQTKAKELDDYLQNGNITNSVNFPNLTMPRSGSARICVLHANIPAIITKITAVLADDGLNIENMTNKSKGDNAYTVVDVATAPSADAIARIAAGEGIYKVRAI